MCEADTAGQVAEARRDPVVTQLQLSTENVCCQGGYFIFYIDLSRAGRLSEFPPTDVSFQGGPIICYINYGRGHLFGPFPHRKCLVLIR